MKNRNYFFIFILTCCSGVVCTAEGQNKNRHYVKNRIMTTDDGNSFREKVERRGRRKEEQSGDH